MGRRGALFPTLMGVVAVVAVLVFYPGAELQIAQEYLVLLPSLFIIIMAIYMAKETKGSGRVIACALMGAGFALLAGELNAQGMWVPTMLITHGLNLQYLQALLVVGGVISGVALR